MWNVEMIKDIFMEGYYMLAFYCSEGYNFYPFGDLGGC